MRTRNENDGVLSARTTRIGLLVAVPLALVFGVQTISWAVPKVWTRDETRTADDLNHNFGPRDDTNATLNQSNPWAACGVFEDLRNGATRCEVNGYSADMYEYGFKYNGREAQVAECLFWNVGIRIVNRHPYMVYSDDPTNGAMQLGGAIFYTETYATDDDIPVACPPNTWRQHYWRIASGSVALTESYGCVNLPLYCRQR